MHAQLCANYLVMLRMCTGMRGGNGNGNDVMPFPYAIVTTVAGVGARLPAKAAPNPVATQYAVSCARAGNCTAVGDYSDGSGNQQGLLLTQTAATWATGVKAPLPAGAGSRPFAARKPSGPGTERAPPLYFDAWRPSRRPVEINLHRCWAWVRRRIRSEATDTSQ